VNAREKFVILSQIHPQIQRELKLFFFFKEVARDGERTRVLLISFIFSIFTTLPLSRSGSPT
jgi:hypothetical protein